MGKIKEKKRSFPRCPHVYNMEMVDKRSWVYISLNDVEKILWGLCITVST